MSYEEQLFDEVIYDAAEELSPSDATDLREWVESLECAKRKVDEYEAKAKAYDDIRYAMEMQTAIGVSDEDTLIDIHHVIMRLIERRESGEYDAEKR